MTDAKEYGKALFLLTEEEQVTDLVLKDIKIAKDALLQNPEYEKLFSDTWGISSKKLLEKFRFPTLSLIVGLIISIFQTVTSIQEQTLTFVPKILCVFLALMLCGSWMLDNMSGFMVDLWSDFSRYVSMG